MHPGKPVPVPKPPNPDDSRCQYWTGSMCGIIVRNNRFGCGGSEPSNNGPKASCGENPCALTVLCSATPDACPRRMSASEWTRAGLEFTPQLCLCLCVDQGQFGPTTRHLQRSRSRSAGMLGIMRAQQSAATGPLATARAAADSSGCAMTRPWVAAALHCGQYRRTMAGDGRERWSVSVRSTVSLCGICATCDQRSVWRHWRRLG